MNSKITVGSLVKSGQTKNVGIVIKLIGNVNDPDALIVKTEGQIKRWTLKKDEEIILQNDSQSLLRRFGFRVTLAFKDLIRVLSSICK